MPARQFSGSNLITCGNGTVYQSLSGITVSAWIKRDATGSLSIPFSVGASSSHAIALYHWSDNKIYFDCRNGSITYYHCPAVTTTGWLWIAGQMWNSGGAIFTGNGDTITAQTASFASGSPPTSTSGSISGATVHLGFTNFSGTYYSTANQCQGPTLVMNGAVSIDILYEMMQRPRLAAANPACLSCWMLDQSGSSIPDESQNGTAGTAGSTVYLQNNGPPIWRP